MTKIKKYIAVMIIVAMLNMDILNLFSGIVYAASTYYIHDNYIERVFPNTDIEEFKNNLDGEYFIYQDSTKTKEVESGIIKTGMVASRKDGSKDYIISVIGDINKDGLFNQVDISLLIKHLVGLQNFILKDILLKSADIKYDENVNQIDLTAAISYLVFGRLDNTFPDPNEEDKQTEGIKIDSFKETNVTINSIEVSISAQDNSGLDEEAPFKYMICEYSNFENAKTIESKETKCLFEGLKNNTTYFLKAVVKNSLGETKETAVISVKTEKIPQVNDESITGTKIIEVTEPVWENGVASVKIINKSNYITQYKVLNNMGSETIEWTSTNEKTKKVENLLNNYIVVVRLSTTEDTVNGEYGLETRIPILDKISPKITLSEQEYYSSETVEVTANIEEGQSGLLGQKWAEGNQNKEYFNEGGTSFEGNIFTVSENGIYTVYAKDKAGNETIQTIKVTKIDRINLIATISVQENKIGKEGDKIEVTVTANRAIEEIDSSKMIVEGNGKEECSINAEKIADDTVKVTITIGSGNGEIRLKLQEGSLKDSSGNANREVAKVVGEADNQGPRVVDFKMVSKSTNTITVQINVQEIQGIGLAEKDTYNYYISTNPKFEYEVSETTESDSFVFKGLMQSTTYYIRCVAKDKLDNKTISSTLTVTTDTVPKGEDKVQGTGRNQIEFSDISWQNEEAKVTVTNNSEYIMQYKVLDSQNQVITEWNNAEETGIQVDGLKNKYLVKARLSDSENLNEGNFGTEETVIVVDTVYPSVVLTQQIGLTNGEVTVNVNLGEHESGIDVQKWAEGEQLDEDYFKTGGHEFTGNSFKVASNGRYTVYVRDKAGNETIETLNVTNQDKSLPLVTEIRTFENESKIIKEAMERDIICMTNKPIESIDASKIKLEGEGANTSTSIATLKEDGTINVHITAGQNSGDVSIRFEEGALTDSAGNTNNSLNMANALTIDNDAPTISNIQFLSVAAGNVTIKVTAEDVGASGIARENAYSFYISKDQTFTDPKEITDADYYTYQELTKETKYYLQVTVKDELGNTATSEIKDVTTAAIELGAIDNTIVNWLDEKASLDAPINSDSGDFVVQYQVYDAGGQMIKDWTSLSKGDLVTDLYHKYKVKLRVSDTVDTVGGNYSEVVEKEILDENPPSLNVVQENGFSFSGIKVSVRIEENESGLLEQKWAKGIKEKEDFQRGGLEIHDLTPSSGSALNPGAGKNFEFTATSNGYYTIYAKDKAGNEIIGSISVARIDKTGPEITISAEVQDKTKIKVTIDSAEDSGVGLSTTDTFRYYISDDESIIEDAEIEGELVQTSTDRNYTITKYKNKELEAGKTYYVYVVAKDKLGNETRSDVQTVEIPAEEEGPGGSGGGSGGGPGRNK